MTKANKFYILLALFVMSIACLHAQDKELAISADNYFKTKQYRQASWQYAQLVSNHPADVRYQYLYGVSRVLSGVNVVDAIKHLEKASMSANTPKDVYYYLGLAYQLTYDFDQSMRSYQIFKKYTGQELLTEWKVDTRIQQCKSGLRIKQLGDKYPINEKANEELVNVAGNYFSENGKLLKITEAFQSNYDKKLNEPQFLFLEANGNRVYYSSKGTDGSYHADIFYANKKGAEKYDKPVRLQSPVNTIADEIYPTTAQNGTVLYFSANNEQSMGGYDVFKCTWNETTSNWGVPENLGMPVNSPYDDYLFLPDSGNKSAKFLSNRDCDLGKVQKFKISLITKDEGKIYIKGNFSNTYRPEDLQATLMFYDGESYKLLSQIQVDTKTGGYEIKLPKAKKYACKIDKPGFTFLMGEFFIEDGYTAVEQEVILSKNNSGKETVAINIKYPNAPDKPSNQPQTIEQMLAASKAAKQNAAQATNNKTAASNSSPSAPSSLQQATKPIAANTHVSTKNPAEQKPVEQKQAEIKRAGYVEDMGIKLTPVIAYTVAETKIKQLCNWKAERTKYAQQLKPKQDAEMEQIAKDKLNQKDKKDEIALKQKQDSITKQNQQLAQSFSLDELNFEDLQKEQSKTNIAKPEKSKVEKTSQTKGDENKIAETPVAKEITKGVVEPVAEVAKPTEPVAEEHKPVEEIKFATTIEPTKVESKAVKQTAVKADQQKNITVKEITKGVVEPVAEVAKPTVPVAEERKPVEEIKFATTIEPTKVESKAVKQTAVKADQQKNITVKEITKGVVEPVAEVAKPTVPVAEERKPVEEIKFATTIEPTKVESKAVKQTAVKADQQKNISVKQITNNISEATAETTPETKKMEPQSNELKEAEFSGYVEAQRKKEVSEQKGLTEAKSLNEMKLATAIEPIQVDSKPAKQNAVKAEQQKNIAVNEITKRVIEPASTVVERKPIEEIKLASAIEPVKVNSKPVKQNAVKADQQKNITVKEITKGVVEPAPAVTERKPTEEIKLATTIESTKVDSKPAKQTVVKSSQQKNISVATLTKNIVEEKITSVPKTQELPKQPVAISQPTTIAETETELKTASQPSEDDAVIAKLKRAKTSDYKERYAVSIRRNLKIFENKPDAQVNVLLEGKSSSNGLKP